MSSSNREAVEYDATIFHSDKAVGPIRLPMKHSSSFVEQFNRIYGHRHYRLVGRPKVAPESERSRLWPSSAAQTD
ncbi:hypothetical protein ACMFWY_09770 [Roseiconus sp. JC912]|uniref:hypothetical protein n=1 Tax=Roseiconus sp. JC912 TaxID=3396307 RepID=UPI003A4C5914